MSEIREAMQIIVMGTNGTGKTTLVSELVKNAVSNKTPVLIVVPDTYEWPTADWVHSKFPQRIKNYVGVRKIVYFDGLLDIIRDNFSNGLLIFDDCRSYIKPRVEGSLHQLLIRRRQQSIDIVAVGHGFTEIPPSFFTFATHYALFRTRDNIIRRKNVINDYDVMVEAQERINSRALDTKQAWHDGGISKNKHYYEILEV
nr:ATP-binding protein [uncultured Draconibacterium sp.]